MTILISKCQQIINVILKDYKNSDFHWITHVLPLMKSQVLGSVIQTYWQITKEFSAILITCFVRITLRQLFRKESVLVSRVLVELFLCFSSLESFIPKHISIDSLQKCQRNLFPSVLRLIAPYNQSRHSDVVQYSGNPISRTLGFPNLTISRTKP